MPRFRFLAAFILLAAASFSFPTLSAQALNRITQKVDVSQVKALPNHHPLWANSANSAGAVPANQQLNQLTLVLARSPEQEQAFEQFIADQQNPASPNFHHWLTPVEVGDRFGLSEQDIANITGWLQSQGLQVNFVAPNRMFVGFSGTAADINHAFQTEMQYYNVRGEQRLSVSSDPAVPAALIPAIQGIRGLYTIDEKPNHHMSVVPAVSPLVTGGGTPPAHYVGPADFSVIYNVPTAFTGAGVTVGIVGWNRTNMADFDNFKARTGVNFTDPTEVVPTAFGGIDPGPALTAPPSGGGSVPGGQAEATLDVLRVGSTSPGASILLVVSSQAGANDGIGADAQYLVGTSPVPAKVMSISFGACEASAGSANVGFWNTLFQTAAVEGISVFVSSGDSGASGCEPAFAAPLATPPAISPNYICSSSYATCVGGTEFVDTASPSTYWTAGNGTGYLSALSYIPEGAWNESTTTSVAGTGGGVSLVIPTPSWQTGTGVPAARTGRYTPDVSFTAAGHDGYFACMAASGGSCVVVSSNFNFVIFSGTSASAPSMAGVAALLDQKLGGAQGNLNPQLYPLATSTPAAFHDATPSSSGVGACSLTTASLCNNSMTNLTGGTAQAGFNLTTGYDEATGLGSLDVGTFLNSYTPGPKTTPTITWAAPAAITYGTALSATQLNATAATSSIAVPGTFVYTPAAGTVITAGTQTLSVTFNPTDTSLYNSATTTVSILVNKATPVITWGTPTSVGQGTALSATQLNATANTLGVFVYNPPAGTVMNTIGTTTLNTTFTPTDATDYTTATASVQLTVTAPKTTPTINWATPAAITYGTVLSATQLNATATASSVAVAGTFAYTPVAGTTLAAGPHTLSVTFTPTDTTTYNSASSTVNITVNKATPLITWANPASVVQNSTLSATQLNATASTGGVFVYTPPAGTVMSTLGSNTLNTTFTPNDLANFTTAVASVTLNVTAPVPGLTVAGAAITIASPGATTGNTSTITVTPTNGYTGSVTLSASITASPAGAQFTPTISFTGNPVSITTTAGTATMSVATTAPTTASLAYPKHDNTPWYAGGGAALACLLFFCVPVRRRKWRNMLGMIALLFALVGGAVACGGSSVNSGGGGTAGTTLGTYTITVTATSTTPAATATSAVTLTVN